MRLTPALVVVSMVACRSTSAAAPPEDAVQWTTATIPWRSGSPTLPPGSRMAILEGDPKRPGIFTMRLEVPAGSRIPPHTHPRPERVTVLSGGVGVGFGERVDEAALTVFHGGDYYVNPPRVPHFVVFREASIVQITGEGPWELTLVKR